MSNNSYFRSSIYHCIETNGGPAPVYFKDGLLVIDSDSGKIIDVGNFSDIESGYEVSSNLIHFKDRLIMSGFVDTHVHYPQYKVIASYGTSLLEWLNQYTFVEEQRFSDRDYADHIANLFIDELIKNGTTTAMTFCTSFKQSVDAFFNASQQRNLRMVAGKVMMDRNAPEMLCDSSEDSYTDSKELIEKWHNKGRLRYAVTPRFAITSSKSQLEQASKLLSEYPDKDGQKGVLLQTHLNENDEEIGWVKELFPDSDNYFGVYDDLGITGSNSVFGHCIHNTDDEYQKMAGTGSRFLFVQGQTCFWGVGCLN